MIRSTTGGASHGLPPYDLVRAPHGGNREAGLPDMPIFRCCHSKLCDRYRSGIFFERTEEHLFNRVTLGDDGTQAHTSSVSILSPATQRCVDCRSVGAAGPTVRPNAANWSVDLEEQTRFGGQLIVPVSSGPRHWLLPWRLCAGTGSIGPTGSRGGPTDAHGASTPTRGGPPEAETPLWAI